MSDIFAHLRLIDPFVFLRVICGLFFIPHIYGKFFVPAALGFFQAAKFQPPVVWLYVACAIEIAISLGLIFGIYTSFVGVLGFLHLMIAALAVLKVSGGRWLWNTDGAEYCVFWGLCCLVVAIHG